MLAGQQRVRIGIWGSTVTGTTPIYNEPIVETAEIKKVWAEVSFRRGREHYESSQVFSMTHVYFQCRYFSVKDITTANWIVCAGQVYDIVDIQPDIQRKDRCQIEGRVRDIVSDGNSD